jgi:Leucine-rich repeat (LRR) protein
MPANGKAPLSKEQTAILAYWLEVGAPENKRLAPLKMDAKMRSIFESFFKLKEDPLLAFKAVPANDNKIQKLQKAGFKVEQIYQNSPLLEVKFSLKNKPPVRLLSEIKDQLVWLHLPNSSLNDEDLIEIGKLTQLFKLNISHNKITDQGLLALSNLKNLRTLNIYGTDINKKGLTACLSLPMIKKIFLWDTNIDSTYLADLQKKHTKIDLIYKTNY